MNAMLKNPNALMGYEGVEKLNSVAIRNLILSEEKNIFACYKADEDLIEVKEAFEGISIPCRLYIFNSAAPINTTLNRIKSEDLLRSPLYLFYKVKQTSHERFIVFVSVHSVQFAKIVSTLKGSFVVPTSDFYSRLFKIIETNFQDKVCIICTIEECPLLYLKSILKYTNKRKHYQMEQNQPDLPAQPPFKKLVIEKKSFFSQFFNGSEKASQASNSSAQEKQDSIVKKLGDSAELIMSESFELSNSSVSKERREMKDSNILKNEDETMNKDKVGHEKQKLPVQQEKNAPVIFQENAEKKGQAKYAHNLPEKEAKKLVKKRNEEKNRKKQR